MRITSKGQVTIPQQVRRELGLEPGRYRSYFPTLQLVAPEQT